MRTEERTCPECGTPVRSASGGRFYNDIRPKDATVYGCEFCDPTPLRQISKDMPARRVGQPRPRKEAA